MLEEQPDEGDVTEERHLVEVATGVAGIDASDDRSVPIHDEQVRLGLALENRRIAARRSLVEVRLVAVDLYVHRYAAVGRDVRSDQELQLRFLKRRLHAL